MFSKLEEKLEEAQARLESGHSMTSEHWRGILLELREIHLAGNA